MTASVWFEAKERGGWVDEEEEREMRERLGIRGIRMSWRRMRKWRRDGGKTEDNGRRMGWKRMRGRRRGGG